MRPYFEDEFEWKHRVSTHAPLRGATRIVSQGCTQTTVSTHAPLRGATGTSGSTVARRCRFNPRTPAGCDQRWGLSLCLFVEFQPTHPCGVRRNIFSPSASPSGFQPTHPCGVRPGRHGCKDSGPEVSTHAPLRGATAIFPSSVNVTGCFNPRTPAGCDSLQS